MVKMVILVHWHDIGEWILGSGSYAEDDDPRVCGEHWRM